MWTAVQTVSRALELSKTPDGTWIRSRLWSILASAGLDLSSWWLHHAERSRSATTMLNGGRYLDWLDVWMFLRIIDARRTIVSAAAIDYWFFTMAAQARLLDSR
jgi:hypothetical protein